MPEIFPDIKNVVDSGERPEKQFPSEASRPDFYILGGIRFFVHRVI